MSLSAFRDHCRTMAAADHKPECKWPDHDKAAAYDRMQARFEEMFDEPRGQRGRSTPCDGCVTDSDRALFAQMAAEVDDYLAPQVDLFGDLNDEPNLETA